MGLVTTLREVQQNSSSEGLNRYNPERPIMVDGSLSELVTQALNIAYSKKDLTTGEPYYGNPNPTGNPPPGAGFIPNIHKPDSPREEPLVRPSLEGMQQMQEAEAMAVASALADAINAKQRDATSFLKDDPLIIYAVPQDNMVSEEMNADIDMYGSSGAVDVRDFVFVYTDKQDTVGDIDYRVYDLNAKIKDYEGRGAKVFPDLQSFLTALPGLRQK